MRTWVAAVPSSNLPVTLRQGVLSTVVVAASLLGAAATASAGTIVVSPSNQSGWTAESAACSGDLTSTQAFVEGPATPPAGAGSRAFEVGANEDSFERYRQSGYQGVKIADLEELSYYTYVDGILPSLPPAAAPYLVLAVDHNGDGDFADAGDDHLIFDPGRQGSPVLPGMWQQWDTIEGNWYQEDTGPAPLFPLKGGANAWATVNPPSFIVNDVPAGGLYVGVGCGASGHFAGSWADFSGNVDALTISATGITDPTYDFEAASPPPPPGGGGAPPPQPAPAPQPGPPGTADLSVAKTAGPSPVGVGRSLTYRIAVANFGPAAAEAATLRDTLPGSVDFASVSTSHGSCSGTQVVTCQLGTLPRDTTATVRIVVRPRALGNIANAVSVSSTTTDSFAGNNSARITTRVADTRPPRVSLSGLRRCALAAGGSCSVRVTSDERGRITANGTVSFPGPAASASFPFRRVRRPIAPGRPRVLRLGSRAEPGWRSERPSATASAYGPGFAWS